MANAGFRTCPTTGLKVDLNAQALIKANAVAAVVFLAIGGLFGLSVALLAGAMAAPLEWFFETFSLPAGGGGWYADWPAGDKLAYLAALVLSGALLAGLLGWMLTRALARAGALSAFPAGQEVLESRAV